MTITESSRAAAGLEVVRSCAGVIFTTPCRTHGRHSRRHDRIVREVRKLSALADDGRVALVFGVDGHRRVAEHRLGTRRGDDNSATVFERIAKL